MSFSLNRTSRSSRRPRVNTATASASRTTYQQDVPSSPTTLINKSSRAIDTLEDMKSSITYVLQDRYDSAGDISRGVLSRISPQVNMAMLDVDSITQSLKQLETQYQSLTSACTTTTSLYSNTDDQNEKLRRDNQDKKREIQKGENIVNLGYSALLNTSYENQPESVLMHDSLLFDTSDSTIQQIRSKITTMKDKLTQTIPNDFDEDRDLRSVDNALLDVYGIAMRKTNSALSDIDEVSSNFTLLKEKLQDANEGYQISLSQQPALTEEKQNLETFLNGMNSALVNHYRNNHQTDTVGVSILQSAADQYKHNPDNARSFIEVYYDTKKQHMRDYNRSYHLKKGTTHDRC